MKRLLALLLLIALTASGAQSPKGSVLFPKLGTKKTAALLPPPPLPPGYVQSAEPNIYASITRTGAQARISWTGGTTGTVFQLRTKTNVLESAWRNVGGPSTNTFAFVPISGPLSMYSVQGTEPSAITNGQLLWLKSGAATPGAQSRVRAVDYDHLGNLVAVGVFQGTLTWGSILTNGGGSDFFIIKFDPQGLPIWAKRIGANLDEFANGVAVDSQNNIIVTGDFAGTVNFGGVTLTAVTPIFGLAPDGFVAKYSPAGNLIWAKRFGGNLGDSGSAIVIDSSDNVFIASTFSSTNADYGPFNLAAIGGSDIGLCKISADGVFTWAKRYGGPNNDSARAIAFRGTDLFVSGQYFGTTDLGGGPRANAGGQDAFFAKYSTGDGSYRSDKTFGSVGNDGAFGIDVDISGNIFVAGQYGGAMNLGCGNLAPGGIYLASFDPTSICRWSKSLNVPQFGFSADNDFATGLHLGSSGNVFAAGQVVSTITFDGSQTSPGNQIPALFVASYDGNGTFRWSSRAVGSTTSQGLAIAVDDNGHVGGGGAFSGTMTVSGQSVTAAGFAVAPFIISYW